MRLVRISEICHLYFKTRKLLNCTTYPTVYEKYYATFSVKKTSKSNNASSTDQLEHHENYINQFITNSGNLGDIETFKQEVFSKFKCLNNQNFDANFMKVCFLTQNYRMGDLYIKYLKDCGRNINTATLSRFLQLCFVCRDQVTPSEVQKHCGVLKSHNQYLDATSLESLILGLCLTEDWREGLTFLKDVEKTCSPRSLALNALADASVRNGEIEISLDLIGRILHSKKKIADFLFNTWIAKSKNNAEVLEVFMQFVSKNEIYPNAEIVGQLKNLFETKKGSKFKGEFTTINKAKGICEKCKNKLKSSNLTDGEFTALRRALMERVLQGPDIFVGSTPEELQNFQQFVEQTSPYDIVIDGLNVAYLVNRKGSGKFKMMTLLTVVNHFADQKKRILVLGKNHMHRWSANIVSEILKKASFFATQDMSRDDPFLLYAALHSGRGTQFLSDDLMRDHMFRLKDYKFAALFRQWQRSSQLQLVEIHPNGRVRVQYPPKYLTVTQCNNGHWHIPYDDGSPRFTYQLPETMLCLTPV